MDHFKSVYRILMYLKKSEQQLYHSSLSLSVLPDYFRQGIAREMIEFALSRAADAGWDAVFLQGDPQFYVRFGFVPAYRFGILHASDPASKLEHCMVKVLTQGALDGITGMTDYD